MAQLGKREQINVRVALRALAARNGGLALLAARMGGGYASLEKTLYGRAPGILLAYRIADMVGVNVEEVLSGRWPDATVCRHCGHAMDDTTTDEETPDAH